MPKQADDQDAELGRHQGKHGCFSAFQSDSEHKGPLSCLQHSACQMATPPHCTVRSLLAWAPQSPNMMHCVGGSEALFECTITVCVDAKTYLNGQVQHEMRESVVLVTELPNFKAVMAWIDL